MPPSPAPPSLAGLGPPFGEADVALDARRPLGILSLVHSHNACQSDDITLLCRPSFRSVSSRKTKAD